MKPDFTGWATVHGLKCADGRTIMGGAFAHQDKVRVPLVWAHQHNDPENVLGHAILEYRDRGVYARAFFNNSPKAEASRAAVEHGDYDSLSIYANKLREDSGKNVLHGDIKEVSLVLAGANPGAKIDNVYLRHGDSVETLEGEAIITFGEPILMHSEEDDEGDDDVTELDPQEVLDTLNDTQSEVLHGLLEAALTHSEDGPNEHLVQTVFASLTEDQQLVIHDMLGEALDYANSTEGDQMSNLQHAEEKTVKDVFETFNEEQKNVFYFLLAQAVEEAGGSAAHSALDSNDTDFIAHAIQEGFANMPRNLFESHGAGANAGGPGATLSHDQLATILTAAKKSDSLKDVFLEHAGTYGIDDINLLFPDAKAITSTPEFISRRMEWVSYVLGKTKHSPFARIKTVHADITADEARARGYVTGALKKDEVFKLLRRITEPTTIYKKQKLDRDDVIDITDLDVIAYIKGEMRLMLDEEIARCILVGDGRDVSDEDKVNEERLRPIATDDDMYAHKVTLTSNSTVQQKMDQIVRARAAYKGSGSPVMFTTLGFLTDMLLERDRQGRKLYGSRAEIAAALQVSDIIDVEVLEQHPEVVGIIVNLVDYTVGADKGGAVAMFDDFDIDYNQHKYLIETRISGALTKAKSAIVIKREVGIVVTPTSPSFDGATDTITYPVIAGVVYRVDGVPVSGDDVITTTTEVDATPATGYSFPSNTVTSWTFVPTP
ncbi:major capsid and protease fusion protein [Arthrobacter phage Sporto]|nr:major capsid and protease fusion protein [Arthrobacter phage Sporto]